MSKYTFILPAYKSDYFEEAIRSILSQTYEDFTLLISDDCSPCDLKSIVDKFDDKRIVYRRNESNIGGLDLVKHWNLLVNQCDSPFLIIASDDDVYSPNFLEIIDDLIVKYPDINLYRGRTETISESGEVVAEDDYFAPLESQISFLRNIYGEHHARCIGNYVFKTDVLKQKNGFLYMPYAWYSDTATTIMMAENGVANTVEAVFQYRASDISITGSNDNETSKDKLIATLEYDEWLSRYIANNLVASTIVDRNNLDWALKHYKKDIYGKFLQYRNSHQFNKQIELYKMMRMQPFFDSKEFLKVYCLFMLA